MKQISAFRKRFSYVLKTIVILSALIGTSLIVGTVAITLTGLGIRGRA